MIIYEVNLSVGEAIAGEYQEWLQEHIGRMLRFDGFIGARWLTDTEPGKGERRIVVQYHLRDRASLDAYLALHAAGMRREGIERFGDGFTATRRVLEVAGEMVRPPAGS